MKSYNYAISVAATIVALLAVVIAAASETSSAVEEETTTANINGDKSAVSEEPIKLVHVLNPGEREYLSPNLIGLQNIAMTFLPLSLNFINIIDAFREIVNGVRYEIVLNAQNTHNNNSELICRLVILEKPWVRTEWGDKYRELQHNNCSAVVDGTDAVADSIADASTYADNYQRLSKVLNDKYASQAFYNGGTRNELGTADMSKLESQILTTTTTPQYQHQIDGDNDAEITTTIVPPELNDNEKKWLDDFLSVGALNFEQTLKEDQQQQQNPSDFKNEHNEPQLLLLNNDNAAGITEAQEMEMVVPQAEQHNNLRVKRSYLTGGQKKLDLKEAEERLESMLGKLSTGDGPTYKIKKIYSATTQVVSGSLTKISVDLINKDEVEEHCNVEIWSQPWLPNSDEITLDCPNKDLIKQRVSRSTEHMEKKHWHKKRNHHSLDKTEHLFNKFQAKFKRHYGSSTERQMRLRIFKENLKTIEELNQHEMGSAKYGITEFADMTSSEYKMRTGLWEREPQRASKNTIAKIPNIELPKEFDWREKGAISKVKNQGNCGSCWAFSVTGNLEGLHAVKTGVLEEYSEQELLDCDTVDSACNGGLPDNAYEAIKTIGGLELESEYPYQARKDHCHFNKTMSHIKVKGHVDLPKNETAMAQWLLVNGPISIGINANAMQFYRGGVSHPWKHLCAHSNLDHGVLIVGYGVSEYPSFKKILPYWIVKNSWGQKWGEQGYYRVYRGDNTCGVSEMATSAVLAD